MILRCSASNCRWTVVVSNGTRRDRGRPIMHRMVKDAIGSEPPWVSATNRGPRGSRPRCWLCQRHWRSLSTVFPRTVSPILIASGGDEAEAVPRNEQAAKTGPEAETGQTRSTAAGLVVEKANTTSRNPHVASIRGAVSEVGAGSGAGRSELTQEPRPDRSGQPEVAVAAVQSRGESHENIVRASAGQPCPGDRHGRTGRLRGRMGRAPLHAQSDPFAPAQRQGRDGSLRGISRFKS